MKACKSREFLSCYLAKIRASAIIPIGTGKIDQEICRRKFDGASFFDERIIDGRKYFLCLLKAG
jgi:hypothetical protein